MIRNFVILISFSSFVVFHVNGRTLQKRAAFYIANETACVVDHTVYYNGDPIPTDDPCEACKCRPPGFACVLKECEVKPGCRAVRRAGHCCPEYICGSTLKDSLLNVHGHLFGSHGSKTTPISTTASTTTPISTTASTPPPPTVASTTTQVPTTTAFTTTQVPTTAFTTTQVPTARIQAQKFSTVQQYKGTFEEGTIPTQVPSGITIKSVESITSSDRDDKVTGSTINELTDPQDITTSTEKNSLFYNININALSLSETSHEASSQSSTITDFQQSSVMDKHEKEEKTDEIKNSPLSTEVEEKSNDLKIESTEVSNSGIPQEEIQNKRIKVSENPPLGTSTEAGGKDSSSTLASVVSIVSKSHETNDSPVLVTTDRLIEVYSTKRNEETELPILYNEELSAVSEKNTYSSSVAENSSHISTESMEQGDSRTTIFKEKEVKPTTEYEPSSTRTSVLTSSSLLPLIYSNEDHSENFETEEKVKNISDEEQLGEKDISEISKSESNSPIQNNHSSLKTSSLEEDLGSSETTNETPNESLTQSAGDVSDRDKEQNKVKKGNEENSSQNVYTTTESSSTHTAVQYHQKSVLVSKNAFVNEEEISTQVLPITPTFNTDQYSTFFTSDTPSSEIQENESKNLETALQTSEKESKVKDIEDISVSNPSSSSDYESTTSSAKLEEQPLGESVKEHTEV